MRHSRVAHLGLVLTILMIGCSDGGLTTAPALPGDALHSLYDGAHGGTEGFYFLPPMAENPAYSGTFDTALQPVVEVCETTACGAFHASYSMTEGVGSEVVRLSDEHHYMVNWHTNETGAAAGGTYRVRVLVNALVLGYADVTVVSTGREAIEVRSDGSIALVTNQTLPIKFRIETGIVGAVNVSPAEATIDVGGTQQFTAALQDLHGAPVEGPAITWSSSDEDLATVSADGLATGVAEGATTITARSGPAEGSATLAVVGSPEGPWALAWFDQPDEAFFVPAMGIDGDAYGNAYLIGRYTGDLAIGGIQLPFGSPQRALLAKYDIDGSLQWVSSFGGTASTVGRSIAAAPNGDFCIAAYFDGTVTVGSGYSFTSGGSRDLLVAKYDGDGGLLWAAAAGGSSSNFTQDVAIGAEGNCIITGSFRGSVSFGSGVNFTSSGSYDNMFVATYGADGSLLWVQTSQGGNAGGSGVDVDAAGNVFVTGHARNGSTFSGTSLNVADGGSKEAFVAKYDPNGSLLWLQAAGGPSQVEAFAIAVDAAGHSHIAGWYWGSATFGATVLPNVSEGRVFVSRLDPQGTFHWTHGGESSGFGFNSSQSIALDPAGNLYFTGSFRDDLTVGGMTLTGQGSSQYVAKFGPGGTFLSAIVGPGGHVTTDGLGNVWVAGTFSGTLEIAGETFETTASNSLYVARLLVGSP